MKYLSLLCLCLFMCSAGCGDDGGDPVDAAPGPDTATGPDATPGPDGPPATFTYTADIQPIFTANCISCHGFLNNQYDMVVGQPSGQLGSMNRIEPGDLDNSYLWHKINNTHLSVGGSNNPMPPPPISLLTAGDISTIETWIMEGAPR